MNAQAYMTGNGGERHPWQLYESSPYAYVQIVAEGIRGSLRQNSA